jgi:hypothetical protein
MSPIFCEGNTMTIRGVVSGGRLEVDVPADWPDGTEVQIQPVDGEMSQEEIARTLVAMDQVKPFEMTAEEEAAWEAQRRARKEADKATFFERAEELRRQWE